MSLMKWRLQWEWMGHEQKSSRKHKSLPLSEPSWQRTAGIMYKLTGDKGKTQQEGEICVESKSRGKISGWLLSGWGGSEQQRGRCWRRHKKWLWGCHEWVCGDMSVLELNAWRGRRLRGPVTEVSHGGNSTKEAVFPFILWRWLLRTIDTTLSCPGMKNMQF